MTPTQRAAAFFVAAIFSMAAGCNSANCKTGTLTERVYLTPPINLDADRLVLASLSPAGLDLSATVTAGLGSSDGVSVELAFPHGYNAGTVVTLSAQAFAGPVLLGEGQDTIHTSDKCSAAVLYLLPLSKQPSDSDGGM